MSRIITFTVKFGAAPSEVQEVIKEDYEDSEFTHEDILNIVKSLVEEYKDANTGVYYICVEICVKGLRYPIFIRIDRHEDKGKDLGFMSKVISKMNGEETEEPKQEELVTLKVVEPLYAFYVSITGEYPSSDLESAVRDGILYYPNLPSVFKEEKEITFAFLRDLNKGYRDYNYLYFFNDLEYKDYSTLLDYCGKYGLWKPAVELLRAHGKGITNEDVVYFKECLYEDVRPEFEKHLSDGILYEEVLDILGYRQYEPRMRLSIGLEL